MEDDFDDFLNSLSAPTAINSGKELNIMIDANSNKNLEDEFLDLLGSSSADGIPSVSVAENTEECNTLTPKNISSPPKTDHDDLLSWLEETPTKQTSLHPDIPIVTTTEISSIVTPDEPVSSLVYSSAQTSSDAFLDLLTPQPTSLSSTMDTTSDLALSSSILSTPDTITSLIGKKITTDASLNTIYDPVAPAKNNDNNFFDDVFGLDNRNHTTFENHTFKTLTEQIDEIVGSPFPDIGKLRALIDEEEHIPQSVRAKVLLLLLTGSCVGDEEAQKFSSTEADRRHYSHLVEDCEALVKSCGITNIQVADHMKDIIILYCQRRSADYRNVFSRIMLSVFGNRAAVSKSIVSSCFYALSSSFLPMIGLQVFVKSICSGFI